MTASGGGETAAELRAASRLAKQGRPSEALATLRRLAASRVAWTPSETERLGRLLRRLAAHEDPAFGPVRRIRLCGQVTTAWLATALTAVAFVDGVRLRVDEADYDNVVQDLAGGAAVGADAVVLVPSGAQLSADDGRDAAARTADECALWQTAWSAIRDTSAARILQVGLDAPLRGPTLVRGGRVGGADAAELFAATNAALRRALPPSESFVDQTEVAAHWGRRHYYDARRHLWTKQPWSEPGVVALASAVWATLRAALLGPKKVLVVDCDHTLWGGVVGETGPAGITLAEGPSGEAFVAFQRYLARLRARGVLLAVATKNEPADARAPFLHNPAMVLSLGDFAAFEAGWGPKSASLRRIADVLRLSLDAFVFFDDSPFERGEVRAALPEVAVVEVPGDAADYVAALDAGRWFDAMELTSADRVRADQYATEARRTSTRAQYGTLEAYLDSLQLVGEVREVDDADFERVVQLVGKTNQFNLTSRRHSPAELRRRLGADGSVGLTLRLRDRFGDYGLVAVAIGVRDPDDATALRVDTLLMSCRAIGRTAEWFLLSELAARARAAGYRRFVGEWIPTAKNRQTEPLYETMGMAARDEVRPDAGRTFDAELDALRIPESAVVRAGAGAGE